MCKYMDTQCFNKTVQARGGGGGGVGVFLNESMKCTMKNDIVKLDDQLEHLYKGKTVIAMY